VAIYTDGFKQKNMSGQAWSQWKVPVKYI
jgi:hypothetical protein